MAALRFWPKWRRKTSAATDHEQRPRLVDSGVRAPVEPWPQNGNGVREVRHYDVLTSRKEPGQANPRDLLSGGLLWLAGLIIAASLAGAGYVAYESQRLFALAHNHNDGLRAAITAALPDAGWASMAVVALVAALRGQSSARARFGVVVFFGLSLGAQVLYAEPTLEGYLVAVIAPVTLAWMLESFVVEVRRWAARRRNLDLEDSPILTGLLRGLVRIPRGAARFALWLVRLKIDRSGTWDGLRQWVLEEAPLAPGRTAASVQAAAAVEQADGDRHAAQLARLEAADAVERVNREAAADVLDARREAEQRIAAAQREAAEQAEQARTDAQAQMAELRAQAEQQISAARADAMAQAEQARAQARADAETIRREAAEQLHQVNEALAAQRRDRQELAERLTVLVDEHERLLASAPAKARLITLYERLGVAGDPRWMSRDRVGEVARELYAAAGLQSEGTARTYLYEYLDNAAVRAGAPR